MKLGILKETKIPLDRRVPFTPGQVKELISRFSELDVLIQPSDIRCFKDEEYSKEGLQLDNDLSNAEVLMGVKEVEIESLIAGKTYLFFSHTAKKQPYNRKLLQEIVKKEITLIDYEYLTDKNNLRIVAFGRWAGIVGAYKGLRAYGERYRGYLLKPAHQCYDFAEMKLEMKEVSLTPVKILVTGGGRVAMGAMEILAPLNLKEVSPADFLSRDYNEPVVCRIDPWDYVQRKDGSDFDLQHFFDHPDMYESTFKRYTYATDILIACHYWDPRSPHFMTLSDMREPEFKIRVIADVSCDINGPIPSTIRASTIDEPFYGYYPLREVETPPFELRSITVMAVDNLPGELPRDASEDFGNQLLERVIPTLITGDEEGIIERATIVKNGKLTEKFEYLQGYLDGKE